MSTHDQLFKELLRACFQEFLELFLPRFSKTLDYGTLHFLDKELFSAVSSQDKREADLLAQIKVHGRESLLLIHVEHQSTKDGDFGRRMFRYFSWIYERHNLPVYPIALLSYDSPRTPEPDHFEVNVQGATVLDFHYKVIQLNQYSWRDFVNHHNPVASALMAKMRMAPRERARVKLECLRLLTTLKLDKGKQYLISGFVDTYLPLSKEEEKEYEEQAVQLPSETKEGIMEIMTSWKREGLEQGLQTGRQEGAYRMAVRFLNLKLGGLPAPLDNRLKSLSTEELDALSEVALHAQTTQDVENWLDKQEKRV